MGFWNTGKDSDKKKESQQKPVPAVKEEKPAPGQNKPAPLPLDARRPVAPASAGSVHGPEERLAERFSKIRSALGPGTVIQGRLSFDTVVRIDGKLSGDVFSSKALIIGETGQVDAQVEAALLIVLGSCRGKIKATERIEVWAGGALEADINTPVLIVEEGSVFSGNCAMPSARKPAAAPAQKEHAAPSKDKA